MSDVHVHVDTETGGVKRVGGVLDSYWRFEGVGDRFVGESRTFIRRNCRKPGRTRKNYLGGKLVKVFLDQT